MRVRCFCGDLGDLFVEVFPEPRAVRVAHRQSRSCRFGAGSDEARELLADAERDQPTVLRVEAST